MTLTDFVCQGQKEEEEEEEEEDLPALKTAVTHRYNNTKITYKSTEEE